MSVPETKICDRCGTPTSPWSCSCGQTRTDAAAPSTRPMTRDEINRRRQWAYAIVRQVAADSPRYGSREWLELPEGSPEKVAAVVRAAECWAREGDDLPARLQLEIEQGARAHKREEDREYQQRAAAHRERYKHLRVVRGAYADSKEAREGRWIHGMPRPGDGGAA